MKKLILLAAGILCITIHVYSQGCIAIRNISGFGQYNLTERSFSSSTWQLNINNRFFKAFRDFKGTKDLHTPAANESIIKSYSLDIDITRLFKNGWSLDLDLPYSVNSRETSIEHGGPNTTRHTTRTAGLGDMRVVGYKWLLTPSVRQKGNIQIGLGIKFPTGDYQYKDYFYKNDTTQILGPVNPSIQLGDGGTGFVTELNGFYVISDKINLYGNLYYLVNPRNTNGVTAALGWRQPTDSAIRVGNGVLSVPDVYSIRFGANLNLARWGFSLGLRDEGAPVHDLVGGSDGVRRPGYTLSVEPGALFKMKRSTIYAYVPVLVAHSIKQTVPDKRLSDLTGKYIIGAGGSGDYQVFVGIQFKL